MSLSGGCAVVAWRAVTDEVNCAMPRGPHGTHNVNIALYGHRGALLIPDSLIVFCSLLILFSVSLCPHPGYPLQAAQKLVSGQLTGLSCVPDDLRQLTGHADAQDPATCKPFQPQDVTICTTILLPLMQALVTGTLDGAGKWCQSYVVEREVISVSMECEVISVSMECEVMSQ